MYKQVVSTCIFSFAALHFFHSSVLALLEVVENSFCTYFYPDKQAQLKDIQHHVKQCPLPHHAKNLYKLHYLFCFLTEPFLCTSQCSNGWAMAGTGRYLIFLLVTLLVFKSDAQLLDGSDFVNWLGSNVTKTCPAYPYQWKRPMPGYKSLINEDNNNILLHSFGKAEISAPTNEPKCKKRRSRYACLSLQSYNYHTC